MILDRLLGPVSRDSFFADTFLRQPFSSPGTAKHLCGNGSWQTALDLLAAEDADVLVVRDGERWPEERVPAPEEAAALREDGYTLLVRHAERHDQRLARLAAAFESELSGDTDVHVYATPGGKHGFGWHYDAEEVFLLQTEGTKEYSLRKNTVNPWPTLETLPQDMRYEREQMPLMKCLLEPGDWLYIPNGWWHTAHAVTDSITLAVGVLRPAAIDLLDAVRETLLSSLLWRQRLPVGSGGLVSLTDRPGEGAGGTPKTAADQLKELADALADDLRRELTNPLFLKWWLEQQEERAEAARQRAEELRDSAAE
ncbi:MAG: cupin-like domain-containing protein [Planctomycetaceae bacterium]|nr:cupin-like domain-containing protein [Planctomycetaceae bacterium]